MTSREQGGRWTWEDVLDTTGNLLGAADQGRTSLFSAPSPLAPSDPNVRYGAWPARDATTGKAYPVSFGAPREPEASGSPRS